MRGPWPPAIASRSRRRGHLRRFYTAAPDFYPFLMRGAQQYAGLPAGFVMDITYLGLLAILVAATIGFMRLCDHLRRRP